MATDNKSKQVQWNQHPIIATVLWMLGSDMNSNNDSLGEKKDSNGFFGSYHVFDTDKGGNLDEYLTQIQNLSSSRPRSYSKENSSNAPNNNSSHPTDTTLHPHTRSPNHNNYQGIDLNNNNNNQADITPSPQWGFFVAITPPQQEVFRRDLVNVNPGKSRY